MYTQPLIYNLYVPAKNILVHTKHTKKLMYLITFSCILNSYFQLNFVWSSYIESLDSVQFVKCPTQERCISRVTFFFWGGGDPEFITCFFPHDQQYKYLSPEKKEKSLQQLAQWGSEHRSPEYQKHLNNSLLIVQISDDLTIWIQDILIGYLNVNYLNAILSKRSKNQLGIQIMARTPNMRQLDWF